MSLRLTKGHENIIARLDRAIQKIIKMSFSGLTRESRNKETGFPD
jgi:hypothetical protein